MNLIDRFLRSHQPPSKEASTKSTSAWAEVDAEGRLVLPPEMVAGFGLQPGTRVRVDERENHFRLHRPITQLTKVYIEPTVACNLDCITCFRNEWDQPMGSMSDTTFASILDGLKALDPIPSLYFGGIGEPLCHPKTPTWVAQVKALGIKVELITNGTTLTEEISRQLIEAGLDPKTPACVIEWATLPRQRTVTGTVESIADAAERAAIRPPGLACVGKVVSRRATMDWLRHHDNLNT